jgi:Na+/H+ antiporter NhaA
LLAPGFLIRVGFAIRPYGLSSRHPHGAGLLSGVGFIMPTYIACLAIYPSIAMLESTKRACVIVLSIAAVIDYIVIRLWSIESAE